MNFTNVEDWIREQGVGAGIVGIPIGLLVGLGGLINPVFGALGAVIVVSSFILVFASSIMRT